MTVGVAAVASSTDDASPAADDAHAQIVHSAAAAIAERVRPRLHPRRQLWGVYRLQFPAGKFGFADAARITDYLADLGVSHIYSSPYLTARSGSTHGYDVVDHNRLNPELGGDEAFAAWSAGLKQRGLGQLLDIVPNHMSVATDANAWWMDVLKHGQASRYASFFDVDWQPAKRELEHKVLLPVLGGSYARVLEDGQLPIVFRDGAFYVQVYESQLPLAPRTWPTILTPGLSELAAADVENPDLLELQSIVNALQHLPLRTDTSPESVQLRRRETLVIENRLRTLVQRSPQIAEHIERQLKTFNGEVGQPYSFDALDRLLDEQAYLLSHWRSGSDEMNYRRFFDVTELAAICTEHVEVFEATHRLPFELAVRGDVDGFRVDHIDGLLDPTQYLWRLQWGFIRAVARHEHAKLVQQSPETPDWPALEPDVLQLLRDQVGPGGGDPCTSST